MLRLARATQSATPLQGQIEVYPKSRRAREMTHAPRGQRLGSAPAGVMSAPDVPDGVGEIAVGLSERRPVTL